MSDITMKQVIHKDLPDNLVPSTETARNYIHSHLTNDGEGGNGEYTFWADKESRDALDEMLVEFSSEVMRETCEEPSGRADAACAISDMQRWVGEMKDQTDAFDIIIYR